MRMGIRARVHCRASGRRPRDVRDVLRAVSRAHAPPVAERDPRGARVRREVGRQEARRSARAGASHDAARSPGRALGKRVPRRDRVRVAGERRQAERATASRRDDRAAWRRSQPAARDPVAGVGFGRPVARRRGCRPEARRADGRHRARHGQELRARHGRDAAQSVRQGLAHAAPRLQRDELQPARASEVGQREAAPARVDLADA